MEGRGGVEVESRGWKGWEEGRVGEKCVKNRKWEWHESEDKKRDL